MSCPPIKFKCVALPLGKEGELTRDWQQSYSDARRNERLPIRERDPEEYHLFGKDDKEHIKSGCIPRLLLGTTYPAVAVLPVYILFLFIFQGRKIFGETKLMCIPIKKPEFDEKKKQTLLNGVRSAKIGSPCGKEKTKKK